MLHFTEIPFYDLTLDQLYEIMFLRQEVFVVEQDCPYIDADGIDNKCIHFCGRDDSGQLVAYTRLVPPNVSFERYSSIGRVITSQKIRRKGQGPVLMNKSIEACKRLWPDYDIKISAQTYLLKFYSSLGFVPKGEGYLEDGIPHVGMVLE